MFALLGWMTSAAVASEIGAQRATPTRDRLELPPEAVKYVLLQRTQLQKFHFRFLDKLGVDYANSLIDLECSWRKENIAAGFLQTLQADFNEISTLLPLSAHRILDIGCGIAGIDILLYDRYRSESPQLFLLDKTNVEPSVFYDFHAKGAFYNSLAAATQTLSVNGVPAANIQTFEARDDNRIEARPGFDLILSLISWGFHYPVGTYLNEVVRVLGPEGRLILDVRKGTDGLEQLRSRFKVVQTISEKPKYLRIMACNQLGSQ